MREQVSINSAMKRLLLICLIGVFNISFSQVASPLHSRQPFISSLFGAKSYNKEVSIFKAKSYLMKEVITISDSVVQFNIEALASAGSGDLTTLVYECTEQKKSGVLFGFYNDYWNDNGVIYQGYRFKNIDKDSAIMLLNKIEKVQEQYTSYLRNNLDQNNVCFSYDDIVFLISSDWANMQNPIRIFWKGFDADWDYSAFKKTLKLLEK